MTRLSETPTVHESAVLRDRTPGRWTEIGMHAVAFGACSDIVRGGNVARSTVGKSCSIAEGARINRCNCATWHASQHPFTYGAAQYGLNEVDTDFFARRPRHRATIGHDGWIGHGTRVLAGVTVGTRTMIDPYCGRTA